MAHFCNPPSSRIAIVMVPTTILASLKLKRQHCSCHLQSQVLQRNAGDKSSRSPRWRARAHTTENLNPARKCTGFFLGGIPLPSMQPLKIAGRCLAQIWGFASHMVQQLLSHRKGVGVGEH